MAKRILMPSREALGAYEPARNAQELAKVQEKVAQPVSAERLGRRAEGNGTTRRPPIRRDVCT